MRAICDYCGKEVDVLLYQASETYKVKDEAITVKATLCKCSCCGEELWVSDINNENLRIAYNEYRKRHNLLMPSQIRSMREKYGLSQVTFAKLLGFGEKTVARYENGSIQDEAHNNLMLLISDPRNLKMLYERNKGTVPMMERFQVNSFLKTNVQNTPYYVRNDVYRMSIPFSSIESDYENSEEIA